MTDSVSFAPCRACGRALKTPESVARGVGPICFRKQNAAEIVTAVAEDKPALEPVVVGGPDPDELGDGEDGYDEDVLLEPALT